MLKRLPFSPAAALNDSAVHDLPAIVAFANLLQKHWPWIAGSVATTFVAAIAYCLVAPPVYQSASQILVINKGHAVPGVHGEGSGDFGQRVGDDLLATHMMILRSRRVVASALAASGLNQSPSIVRLLHDGQSPVDYVIDNLVVSRGGEGQGRAAHIISVQFRHREARETADVLKAVLASYRTFIGEQLATPVDDALRLITHAEGELAAALRQTRDEYQAFREQAPLFWRDEQRLNVHQARFERLDAVLASIQLQRVDAQAKLATLQRHLQQTRPATVRPWLPDANARSADSSSLTLPTGTSRPGVAVPPHRPIGGLPEETEAARTEFHQLLELKQREQELLTLYGVDHPQVRSAQRLISHLESFLDAKRRELTRDAASLTKTEIEELGRRESEIILLLRHEQQAAKTLVEAEVKDEAFRRDLDRQQLLFDAVVARLKEVDLARSYGGFTTEVMAPILIGEHVSPSPSLVIPFAFLVGLGAGIGSAVVRDQWAYCPVSTLADGVEA